MCAIGWARMASRISAPRDPRTRTTWRMPPVCSCCRQWQMTGSPPKVIRTLGACAVSSTLGREATESSAVSQDAFVSFERTSASNATDSVGSAMRPDALRLWSRWRPLVSSSTSQSISLAKSGRSTAVTLAGVSEAGMFASSERLDDDAAPAFRPLLDCRASATAPAFRLIFDGRRRCHAADRLRRDPLLGYYVLT